MNVPTLESLKFLKQRDLHEKRERANRVLYRKVLPWLAKHPLKSFKTKRMDLLDVALDYGLQGEVSSTFGEKTYYLSIPD